MGSTTLRSLSTLGFQCSLQVVVFPASSTEDRTCHTGCSHCTTIRLQILRRNQGRNKVSCGYRTVVKRASIFKSKEIHKIKEFKFYLTLNLMHDDSPNSLAQFKHVVLSGSGWYVSGGQSSHLSAVPVSDHLPGSHVVQLVALSPDHVPPSHLVHEVSPLRE